MHLTLEMASYVTTAEARCRAQLPGDVILEAAVVELTIGCPLEWALRTCIDFINLGLWTRCFGIWCDGQAFITFF